MDNFHNNRRNIRAANKCLHREVLLSYRLLFGQDKKSRALFNNREIKEASVEGTLDPLLVQLCGQKRQLGDILEDEAVVEQDCYVNVIDFPFFGRELVQLQKYAYSRKPRRYLDVWRDPRGPFQWLTLWLLVFIGGLSVFLSLLQTAASVIQAVKTFD